VLDGRGDYSMFIISFFLEKEGEFILVSITIGFMSCVCRTWHAWAIYNLDVLGVSIWREVV